MAKIAPPGVRHLIAVASGKGGVGKTTTTVNLALALQQLGLRVGIYDADIYGPNVPLLLGIHQRRTVDEAYATVVRAEERRPYIRPLVRFGLSIMSIGLLVGEGQVINPQSDVIGALVLRSLLDVQWGALDILLLDLPPSSGEPQETLLTRTRLDGAVIVTTPQDLSLLDAGRALLLFEKNQVPILGVVENMSYFICSNCQEKHEIFQRSAQWEMPILAQARLLGRIPLDTEISRSINRRHPLIVDDPTGPHAAAFLEIAREVTSQLPIDN